MRTLAPCGLAAALLLTCAAAANAQDAVSDLAPGVYAELRTNKGTMVVQLHYQQAPRTVANFVGLIEGTKRFKDAEGKWVKRPFYDGLSFHRVIDGFMVQGGCPQGTGMGGPGYAFQDETVKGLTHDAAGVLSMANSDRGKTPWKNTGRTNGSQFFLTLGPTPHLDGLHTVFGKLVKGLEVLQAIGKVPTGANDKPTEPVTIEQARVIRVGVGQKEVPPAEGEADPATQPSAEAEAAERVTLELLVVHFKGCERARPEVGRSQAEALELAKRLEAHARLRGANFTKLVKTFSDLPAREFTLVAGKNDQSFAPAFKLKPGQVSAPFVTPHGVVIARAK